MIEHFLALPVMIPLVTAVLIFFLRSRTQGIKVVSLVGSGVALLLALVLLGQVANGEVVAVQMAGWKAPAGITLVLDPLSGIMLALATLTGLVVQIYAWGGGLPRGREPMSFYILYQFLLMGVCGAFLTGDLFNLFVFFEVMLISSFGLMTLGSTRAQLEGGLKYVVINMVSSILFLSSLGIVYGTTGTLNMADLSVKLAAQSSPAVTAVLAMLFLVSFGIKAGLFPLFFWLPDSYHTPPPVITALFAGLLTKVGVYALIRVFTLIFLQDTDFTHGLILVIAGLTMFIGVLGAAAQNNIRRILSFHIISQIGYMVMGLGLFTPLALAGAILFVAHNILAKTALFLVSGIIEHNWHTDDLKKLGGLLRTSPWLAVLFMVPALTLAGLPPLFGFFSKYALLRAGLETEQYFIVFVSLVVSVLTLFSMMKIWNEAFWKPSPDVMESPGQPTPRTMLFSLAFLGVLCILFGVFAENVYELAHQAAAVVLNPELYQTAVLSDSIDPDLLKSYPQISADFGD
ncbi:MAG: Na+/H+ antiporter subunit D [Anaerolineae bacterium]|nr:Na+/H+ antiporter subunit D [Anaerolineae bacterium]